MVTIYAICSVVGLILVTLSLLGHDHAADIHGDVHFDASHGMDHSAGHGGAFMPFLSLRFWSFFLSAFGLSGMVLTFFGGAPFSWIPWLAAGTGLFCGLAVALILKSISRQDVTTNAAVADLLGKEAEVTVAIRGSTPGRIRCSIKGDLIDMMAVSDSDVALETGSSVIIADIVNDRAKVIARAALFASSEEAATN